VRVLSLELANFRNYAALRFEPPEGACVLIGANAQGKSNLLEGLALLALGKSFRTSREADLILLDAPAASVSARVRTRAGEISVACHISRDGAGARKRFVRNGRAVSYGNFLGGVAAVTFVPADLEVASGPASGRRRMLNATLSQSKRAYYSDLARYSKTLGQKNAFLRSPDAGDRTLLATYNEQLVETGTRLVAERAAYVRRLDREASAMHARWVGESEALSVTYQPVPEQPDETPDAIAENLRAAMQRNMPAELARKMALYGPHRDDVAIGLSGLQIARYGSQGQQRMAVLALKAAEYSLLAAAAGEAPLLLLDDVLSELDAARRHAFLDGIAGYEQAFITATDIADPDLESAGRVIEVRGGELHAARPQLRASAGS
jgi:DNA replication and repair protein RecF